MNPAEILEAVSALILSIGGAGAIIVSVASFLSNRIANRLEEKYQLKIDKELEKFKANLEQRTYVSRIQFDVELEIYRKITKEIFEFMVVFHTTINEKDYPKEEQSFPIRKIEDEKGTYIRMVKNASALQELLYENGAFIPGHLFNECKELIELCTDQFWIYIKRFNSYMKGEITQSERITSSERDAYDMIEKKFEDFNNHLREYLRNLIIVA